MGLRMDEWTLKTHHWLAVTMTIFFQFLGKTEAIIRCNFTCQTRKVNRNAIRNSEETNCSLEVPLSAPTGPKALGVVPSVELVLDPELQLRPMVIRNHKNV